MKRVLASVAAIGLMTAASAAFGQSIVNSKHNLAVSAGAYGPTQATLKGQATDSSQICIYCHAPHNAQSSIPLWNRSNPAGSGFTLYSGINMQSRQFATGFTADSTSLFCMSCHDGTTAMSAVFNQGSLERGRIAGLIGPGTAGLPLVSAALGAANQATLGTDLSKTHPINFPVPTVNNTQNDLWVGSGASMGGGAGSTADAFPLFKANGRDGGVSRSLECGSCHAVHDANISPFLRFTMEGSKLCLGCHNK